MKVVVGGNAPLFDRQEYFGREIELQDEDGASLEILAYVWVERPATLSDETETAWFAALATVERRSASIADLLQREYEGR